MESNHVTITSYPNAIAISMQPGDWATIDSGAQELNLLAAIIHQAIRDLRSKNILYRISARKMLECSFIREWDQDLNLVGIIYDMERRIHAGKRRMS